MSAEDLLTRTFAEVTDATEYPMTPLSSVVARFERQRGARRRRIAYATAAAVVVVGGLSAALAVRGGDNPPPAPAGPLGKLHQGAAPRIDYLDDDTFITTSGERITSPTFAEAAAAAAWGKGVLVASPGTSRHPFATISFVSGGTTSRVGCGTGSFVIPSDGGDPAYWLSSECNRNREGRLVQGYDSIFTPKGAVLTPVGQVSSGYAAFATATQLRLPSHAVVIGPQGSIRAIPHLEMPLAATEAGGLVSGLAQDGSRYTVVDATTGDVRWQTPSWTLGKFSASGQYVAGAQGPRFGNSGVNAVAVFDSVTGRPVMRREFANLIPVALPVWEGNDAVLVVAQDAQGREAIIRVGLDGAVTRATSVEQDTPPPESGRPPLPLFRLASTP